MFQMKAYASIDTELEFFKIKIAIFSTSLDLCTNVCLSVVYYYA